MERIYTRFEWSKPLIKWWTAETFGHFHYFHGLKLPYLFIFKDYYKRNKLLQA